MSLPAPSATSAVVVTGASSGIGEELARQLAAKGHALVLVARRASRLERLADDLRSVTGVQVHVVPADLGEPLDRELVATMVDELGLTVVGLCNNAGFAQHGVFAMLDQGREREMVRVNVDALHHLTGAFLPRMVERGEGAVLNVASLAGNQPLPHGATYAATKAFVTAFSQALHAELHGAGVSVTALCPGPVPTEFADVAGIPDVYATLPGFVQVSAAEVARAGIRGMERAQRVVTPGLVSKGAAIGGRFVPRSVFLPIAEKVTRDRMVSRP